jgi:hypothetical protein
LSSFAAPRGLLPHQNISLLVRPEQTSYSYQHHQQPPPHLPHVDPEQRRLVSSPRPRSAVFQTSMNDINTADAPPLPDLPVEQDDQHVQPPADPTPVDPLITEQGRSGGVDSPEAFLTTPSGSPPPNSILGALNAATSGLSKAQSSTSNLGAQLAPADGPSHYSYVSPACRRFFVSAPVLYSPSRIPISRVSNSRLTPPTLTTPRRPFHTLLSRLITTAAARPRNNNNNPPTSLTNHWGTLPTIPATRDHSNRNPVFLPSLSPTCTTRRGRVELPPHRRPTRTISRIFNSNTGTSNSSNHNEDFSPLDRSQEVIGARTEASTSSFPRLGFLLSARRWTQLRGSRLSSTLPVEGTRLYLFRWRSRMGSVVG